MSATENASFAYGMFVTLWPKVERCYNYAEVLSAAQGKLQHTVDTLIADLQEAEKTNGKSLVGYADRLRNFPARVENLQKKLARIEARLVAIKELQRREAPARGTKSADKPAIYPSPLF
ncbi:hypothetical protein PsorP6_003060 [Peronosclerospora sorghi]|uniref:Uncharacterized protein n=1 Tax=Peronosclerospora sorghi TaxID=230839 RepID=A0ACC0VMK6_9STRA|nr:hypothetical protein PsorP6_003060 [Peronosclerospora sorghi]